MRPPTPQSSAELDEGNTTKNKNLQDNLFIRQLASTIKFEEDTKTAYIVVTFFVTIKFVEDTKILILAGSYKNAVDLGTEKFAFPAPIDKLENSTSFKLRLAPGEGTVIRLEKKQKEAQK